MTSDSLHRPGAITLSYSSGDSIRAKIESLFLGVRGRRDPVSGEPRVSQVMWHLVAAVMSLKGRLDSDAIARMSPGDAFRTGNTVIHVTFCPEWPLMHQCFAENDQGLRPLILSTRAGAAQAEALTHEVGMDRKVEVLDITQFLIANLLERPTFNDIQRRQAFEALITLYNSIIEGCETDPSLKIEVA